MSDSFDQAKDFFFSFCLFVFFFGWFIFERERETSRRGEAERVRENPKQAPYSTEPDTVLNPTNCEVLTGVETQSQKLNRLSHPGAPSKTFSCSCSGLLTFELGRKIGEASAVESAWLGD